MMSSKAYLFWEEKPVEIKAGLMVNMGDKSAHRSTLIMCCQCCQCMLDSDWSVSAILGSDWLSVLCVPSSLLISEHNTGSQFVRDFSTHQNKDASDTKLNKT